MQIDVRHIQLNTPRLLLRPWMDSDIDDFYAFASIPEVGRMAGWYPQTSKEGALAFLRAEWWRRVCLAIYHLQDKKVIGSVGLHKSWASNDMRFNHLKSADISYSIHPDYWNMGIATEAAKGLISYCFKHLDIKLVSCGHFVENLQSKRVIEKCGFVYDNQKRVYSEELNMNFLETRYVLFAEEMHLE